MAKLPEVEVKLADGKMVMDLVQSANDVVSSAVEHQAGCRAKGIDFCVVCANVGDMVKPLREFFRRWCQNDPPAPPIEPTAECKAAMAENAQEARAGGKLPETDLDITACREPKKEICYYCHHEATQFVREHNATGIPVCADHGHGPIQARDDRCEMCKSQKGPIIRIPTGGGQFITCIPCAKAMRVALKEVIEEVEEGRL